MSYCLTTPCYNCKKGGTTPQDCTDMMLLTDAVNKIHSKTYDEGHKGSGNIVLCCNKMDPKQK